jgi:hypothetical protein
MSALTLLVSNDVPGLQLWKDNHWVAVNYLQNALFVHIGDQVEVKTCHNLIDYILSFMKFVQSILSFFVLVGVEQWEVQECFAQKLGEQGTQAHVVGCICYSST